MGAEALYLIVVARQLHDRECFLITVHLCVRTVMCIYIYIYIYIRMYIVTLHKWHYKVCKLN